MSHFDNLEKNLPDLKKFLILDVGCGRGDFLLQAAHAGATAVGLEKYDRYIEIAKEKGRARGFDLDIRRGQAESLPFVDHSFDFVNMAEVFEHVEDPITSLREIHRVLKEGGQAYVSVPNRFGLKDPHYKIYFINWLPRTGAEKIINWLGKNKNAGPEAGRQKLAEMHYYTFGEIKKIMEQIGFNVIDNRQRKLSQKFGAGLVGRLADFAYQPLRGLYFAAAHLYLKKI